MYHWPYTMGPKEYTPPIPPTYTNPTSFSEAIHLPPRSSRVITLQWLESVGEAEALPIREIIWVSRSRPRCRSCIRIAQGCSDPTQRDRKRWSSGGAWESRTCRFCKAWRVARALDPAEPSLGDSTLRCAESHLDSFDGCSSKSTFPGGEHLLEARYTWESKAEGAENGAAWKRPYILIISYKYVYPKETSGLKIISEECASAASRVFFQKALLDCGKSCKYDCTAQIGWLIWLMLQAETFRFLPFGTGKPAGLSHLDHPKNPDPGSNRIDGRKIPSPGHRNIHGTPKPRKTKVLIHRNMAYTP